MNFESMPKCRVTGKVSHAAIGSAKVHADALSKHREIPYEPYRCRHCSGFHVGRSLGADWLEGVILEVDGRKFTKEDFEEKQDGTLVMMFQGATFRFSSEARA